MSLLARAAIIAAMTTTPVVAADLNIVAWNISPESQETVLQRFADIARLSADLKPDVLVLVEVTGEHQVKQIADALGWDTYYAATSNWGTSPANAYFALESAVISRVPITRVIEFDASPDGTHDVISSELSFTLSAEEEALTSDGIAGFGETVAKTDRGTMRVDLENGLTVFPLHLKSNRVGQCSDLQRAGSALRSAGIEVPAEVQVALNNGFAKATETRLSNAAKRERVMAATIVVAEDAVADGRTVVIAGDMNTAFEAGKSGSDLSSDCMLSNFSCAKAPFPAAACSSGDGFDDTLGMLEAGLVGDTKWTVLSKGLPRTYDDPAFADAAIDHIVVPAVDADRFSEAIRASETYGSDHYPVATTGWMD